MWCSRICLSVGGGSGLYEKSCLFPECKLSRCRDTGDLSWRKQCLQKLKWKILRQEKLVLSLAQNLGPLLRESMTPRWEWKPPGWVRQLRENKCVQGEGMTWERRLWDGYCLGSVPKRNVFPASSCHHTPPLGRMLHFFIHLLNYTFFHLLTYSKSIYSAPTMCQILSEFTWRDRTLSLPTRAHSPGWGGRCHSAWSMPRWGEQMRWWEHRRGAAKPPLGRSLASFSKESLPYGSWRAWCYLKGPELVKVYSRLRG